MFFINLHRKGLQEPGDVPWLPGAEARGPWGLIYHKTLSHLLVTKVKGPPCKSPLAWVSVLFICFLIGSMAPFIWLNGNLFGVSMLKHMRF